MSATAEELAIMHRLDSHGWVSVTYAPDIAVLNSLVKRGAVLRRACKTPFDHNQYRLNPSWTDNDLEVRSW